MPPKKAKGKKKGGDEDEEEEIPEEFRDLSTPMLREKIQSLQIRLVKSSKDRNYMQLENDMVHRFLNITQHEVQQTASEIGNKNSKSEILERDHRTHLKVHAQKCQNQEFEHQGARRLILSDGDGDVIREKDSHRSVINGLTSHKESLKLDAEARKLADQEDLKMLKVGFERNLRKLRQTFQQNHLQLEKNYRDQIDSLKLDLQLKRKCQVHEVEERKNQHINDLLLNHQESFHCIKVYYQDITHDNLELIKSLKSEINDMKDEDLKNIRKMGVLSVQNRELGVPLGEKIKRREELVGQLKSHSKDKLALKNLLNRCSVLDGEIKESVSKWRGLEERYSRVEKERSDLYLRFKGAVAEIKKKGEFKNVVLDQKLRLTEQEFLHQQTQLAEFLQASKLDPNTVQSITTKLNTLLADKNKQIKNLEYQVHQKTKQYNDTVGVFESKLRKLGLPSDELGFEQIMNNRLGSMPAGMVTKG